MTGGKVTLLGFGILLVCIMYVLVVEDIKSKDACEEAGGVYVKLHNTKPFCLTKELLKEFK